MGWRYNLFKVREFMREKTNHRHNDVNHYFFVLNHCVFIVILFYTMVKITNRNFLQSSISTRKNVQAV